MPSKQVAPQDVMVAPVAPTASSVSEAIEQNDQAVAAPGLWGDIKRGVKKLTGGSSSSSSDSSTSTSTSTGGGGSSASSTSSSTVAPTEPEEEEAAPSLLSAGLGVASGIGMGMLGLAAEVIEFAQEEPHGRLGILYARLGATDAFLDGMYADAALRQAALDLGYDRIISFMARSTLSDDKVGRFSTAFGSKMTEILGNMTAGSAMTPQARLGLRRIVAGMQPAMAMVAFGKRFGHAMVDNGGAWTMPSILAVWDQLAVLPDQDCTELTVLTSFQAIGGSGGFGPSWEAPDTVNTIQIGEDAVDYPDHLAHTVRHEIGHAVHAEMPGNINPWLQSDVNFWFYNNDTAGLRQWITELGGFPATYLNPNSGDEEAWDDDATHFVLEILKSFIGNGSSWSPSRVTVTDGQGAWETAWWNAMPDTVKDAVDQSVPSWYQNWSNFGRGTKGRYFLNYWYARPFYMSDTAAQVVTASGDDYTAMSEKEFFANAYAEYFKDPAGYADHTKWGGTLPNSVKTYFQRVVVDRQPYQAPSDQVQQNANGAGNGTPPAATGMAGTP